MSAADVVLDRPGVVALCLAALDTVGARRRVAELLTEAALFAEDRGKTPTPSARDSLRAEDHLDRLAEAGVRLPGSRRTDPAETLTLRADVAAALRRRAGARPDG